MSSGDKSGGPVIAAKLAGEWFREVSVLVMVFGVLDGLVQQHGPPLPWFWWIVLVSSASAFFFFIGYKCETEWGFKK